MTAMKLNGCCIQEEFDDSLKEKCADAMKEENPFHRGFCFMDCAFKETEIFDEDGNISKEKLLEVSEQYLAEHNEAELSDLMEEAVNHCYEKCEFKLFTQYCCKNFVNFLLSK